jgi:hypothetical protein
MRRNGHLTLVPVLVVLAAACQEHPASTVLGPADPVIATHDEARVLESAEQGVVVLGFEAAGLVDGRWFGRVLDPATGAAGQLEVMTETAETRGETVHLVQTWVLIPPDPIIPPDPVRVALVGILNLASGELVLSLHPPDPIHPPDPVHPPDPISPHRVHVRGTATTGEGGVVSVIGELMFNPQPEPPGLL